MTSENCISCDSTSTSSTSPLQLSTSSPFSSSSTLIDSTMKATNKCQLDKYVRFGSIEIRDMPIELGDHPPTTGGAPLTIGWKPTTIRHIPVDVYEICRADEPVRSEKDLQLGVTERAHILLKAGYSIKEIARASEEAHEVLKQREQSLVGQKMELWHVVRESAKRKITRVLYSKAA